MQSFGEEIANSVSHGAALVAALVGVPFLVVSSLRHNSVAVTVGASVFAASMVILYLASTLYHAMPHNRAKRFFQVLDHSAIYLLIAGTYTPFTLGVLRGPWGWTLFGVVWALAVIGLVFTSLGGIKHKFLSISLYLGMGWAVVVALRPLWLALPGAGLAWLVGGGIAYTVGVAFYAARRMPYAHFIWHLFVMLGTACHFFAVLWYAAA